MTSEEVHKEVETARGLGKPIVPVRLDATLQIVAIESLVGKIQFVEDPGDQPSQALEAALRATLDGY
jgi:hypothetical protein